MFRICKADAPQDECLGILALYPDDRKEALGQVRFDQYLSDGLNIEDCYFSNQTINGRLCVMVRTPLHRHGIGGRQMALISDYGDSCLVVWTHW